jgi:hypothetical protein
MRYKLKNAETINQDIADLPTAEELKLWGTRPDAFDASEKELVVGYKAIKVTEKSGKVHYVNCPSKHYVKIEHAEAFRPVIEGLTLSGQHNFQYILVHNERKAFLQIYTGMDSVDSVKLGFTVFNTFDGTGSLNYGIKMMKQMTYVEVTGWRQVCSNGLKIRVPLSQAEVITNETMTKVKTLFKEHAKIRHSGDIKEKIASVQYVVEAMGLLRGSVEAMINRSQNWSIEDQDQLKALVKKHVGTRYAERVLSQYKQEEPTLWGLYNAITFVASHEDGMRLVTSDNLINKAADMLNIELFASK